MKKKTVTVATLGLAVGTGLGMMYAPKKGKELRKDLKEKMCNIKEKIQKTDSKDLKESLEKKLETITKKLEDLDKEKVKKVAEKKAKQIEKDLEELIKSAKDKKDNIIEESETALKEKAIEVTKEILEKLEEK